MPRPRGIIIADTKFEFGFVGDELVLGDEVLTPDSSRFWPPIPISPAARRTPTTSSSCAITWSRFAGTSQPPAPPLPAGVAGRTSEKYKAAYRAFTGREL